MKIKKFKVDVYDWKVTLIEITSKKDYKKVIPILKKFGCEKEIVKNTKFHIKNGSKNGGHHSYDTKYWESIILIYPSTSKKERMRVLCHEKRHCEDKILEELSVYGVEAPAYLAGYLAKKLFFK
jgi:hypothetical protein